MVRWRFRGASRFLVVGLMAFFALFAATGLGSPPAAQAAQAAGSTEGSLTCTQDYQAASIGSAFGGTSTWPEVQPDILDLIYDLIYGKDPNYQSYKRCRSAGGGVLYCACTSNFFNEFINGVRAEDCRRMFQVEVSDY